ncbi:MULTISPECIES: Ger(x)C family spore germination protein [unclassified Paenibacillus]|uniref:Ger(x)C family spore germination protein n=1 Tax=unclassified Paenibacillus TaxID=185978 RepID=UPI000CFDAED8|nr:MULTISPECIES: Ger(x)C family spore germination protein [unclassified Paenibacillus]PQZ97895.1 spore gernimation protein GerC [Paenibacillus sp. MYb63]PRA42563.1 spore gernimation protein GerC [Paenibacillus sp. MYb67]QZN77790.1 Ger(x)C family spore germination protein [Paenibacillus sp. DR312]
MNRCLRLILSFALLLPLLTGCWDRQELNELGIMLGLGVDKDGDMIKVSAQVVVPNEVSSKAGGGKGTPVTQYQASAATLFEAIQKLTETSPRRIFMAHIRVLVFGEEYARKDGIYDVIEALMREPTARPDYYVMVAKNTTASHVLDVLTPLENIPAEKLFNSLDVSAKTWSPTTTVTGDELMDFMISPGIQPVITGVEILGNQEQSGNKENIATIRSPARLNTTGLSVFRKDKLIGWLTEDESKGYNYIRDNVESTVSHMPCRKKGNVTFKTLRTTTKRKAKIVNGKPVINIDIKNVSSIGAVECGIRIGSMKVLKELESDSEERLIELMQESVHSVRRKFHVDIFGFGQEVYHADPKFFKKIENDWDKYFEELDIKYKANVQIKRVGTLDDSFKDELKE